MSQIESMFLKAPAGKTVWAVSILLTALSTSTSWAQSSPGEWLDRMSSAVRSTNYEGTVIRHQNGETEALKVAHKIVDGVVTERLASQEGNGLEIIRIGDEVHCILPDRKSVLVETWNNQSTLFSALPQREATNTPHYDLSLVREGRVAGRPAVMIAVRPHDEYRFGHRIWLDKETAFPLKTSLVNLNGDVVEDIKFADITISDNINAAALDPSVSLESFTWYRESARYHSTDIETRWQCDDLPAGFRAVSTRTESTPADESGAETSTTHIVYSDGIASVSVFIADRTGEERDGWALVGTSNSFTAEVNGFQVTAVGEVPGVTVQRIASSMRHP
ncbi:MAG: MucB/RseB C-terminal domain-containing protein [Woeseiaceae bacterium]